MTNLMSNTNNKQVVLWSFRQASRETGVPVTTLKKIVVGGKIPILRCGNRTLVNKLVLLEYLNQGGEVIDTAWLLKRKSLMSAVKSTTKGGH